MQQLVSEARGGLISPAYRMSGKNFIAVSIGFAGGMLMASILSLDTSRPSGGDCLAPVVAAESDNEASALAPRQRSGGRVALENGANILDAQMPGRRRVIGFRTKEPGRQEPSPEEPPDLGPPLEPEMVQGLVDVSYEAAAEMERSMLEAGASSEQLAAVNAMARYSAEQLTDQLPDASLSAVRAGEYLSPEEIAYQTEASLSRDGAPEVMIEHVAQSLLAPPEMPVGPPDDPRQIEMGDSLR